MWRKIILVNNFKTPFLVFAFTQYRFRLTIISKLSVNKGSNSAPIIRNCSLKHE